MADPTSCPDYDEDADRQYVESYSYKKMSPTEIAHAESKRIDMEVESLTKFVERIEGELDGMGIKVTKVEEIIKDAPDWF